MAPSNLQLSAASSNPGLVPLGNIVFGGSGANRTVTVTPAAGQTGSATITVTVNDGPNNTSTNFVVTVSPAPPPPSLMAAYGFNEGSGTVVNDVSGNGNNGTISGATWTTSGKYGNALTFNGTSARVTVNDSNSLDLTTGMTLEAWLFPTAVGGWRDVIYKGTDDIYYLMGSSDDSTPALGGTFSPSALRGTSSLPLNAWTYLAGTYNGTTMRLYVNGVQVSSRAQTGPIQTSTAVLTMGGDALYGQYFAVRIDEVRIYNRALSAAEIQSDMSSALGAGPPDTEAPSAPGNLVATALGVSQVHLSWTASTDNVGVAGYLVERQDPGSASFVQVGTSTGTSYNDTGLVAGSAYSYRVRATDAAQNLSEISGVASALTQAGVAASDNFNRADGGLGANWTEPLASENNLVIVNNQVGVDVENSHNMPFGRLIASAKISIPRCGSAMWGRGTG